MFKHRCSDVRIPYDIPESALLVCKLTPSRADFAMLRLRCPSFGRLQGMDVACFPACRKRCREVMLPVGSPGLSWIFAGSQKSPTPRTPSGPRLAMQAAGPSTRPDEAGVTFPRCDTLPGITSERRLIAHFFLAIFHFLSHLFLSAARVGRITALCLTTPSES